MKSTRNLCLTVLSLCIWFCIHSNSVHAQNCPNLPQVGAFALPPNSTVKVYVAPSISSLPTNAGQPSPLTQMKQAFAAWQNALAGQSSQVTFEYTDDQSQALVTLAVNADETGTPMARTKPTAWGEISLSHPATVEFNPNAHLPQSTTTSYDPGGPLYDSVYLQVTLHEIGHLLGFADYAEQSDDPGPGKSVMTIGRGPNDIGNFPPMQAPTSCDYVTASNYLAAVAAGNYDHSGEPSGSGGGSKDNPGTIVPPITPSDPGSGGGGGGPACYDYWDPDSNTLTHYC